MAGSTGDVGVAKRQREAKSGVVEVLAVEFDARPIVKRMTVRAIRGRKSRSGLAVNWCCRPLIIRHVARFACRRKPQVISRSSIFVTLLAFHYCVRTEQGKPIEVLLNRLDRNIPAENRVAFSAIRAELAAVNIRVTIGAIFPNVREYGLDVARCAGYFFVLATQWIARRVVVEFGDSSDRCPTCARVAVFAGNC